MPRVGGQLDEREWRAAVGQLRRPGGERREQVVELGSRPQHPRARHVPPDERRETLDRPDVQLDLEYLALETARPQGREAPAIARHVGPARRVGEKAQGRLGARQRHRVVGRDGLLLERRARGREPPGSRVHAAGRVELVPLGLRLERDPVRAARIVHPGRGKPVAQQRRAALQQRVVIEPPAPRATTAAVGAVKGREVARAQPPPGLVAARAGRENPMRQPEIGDLALVGMARVVGSVEKVRDPRRSERRRDRRSGPRQGRIRARAHAGIIASSASQQEMHMELLDLTPDELLSTTRAVRRRLDLTRPVERDVLEECVRLAVQAPTSTNTQNWHFLIVTDAARKTALAELYRRSWTVYNGGQPPHEAPADTGSRYLAQHLEHVPVHVIPCITGRPRAWPRPTWPGSTARSSRPAGASSSRPARAARRRLDDAPPGLRARGGRRPRHPVR